MLFQKPKGTQDILPGEVERWQFLESKARDICRRFHYKEVRTPIFEHTELFQRGVGETTDIVEKEMYTFLDKGDRSVTLRPEGTAGVVRTYVENKLYAEPDIQKLFYIGPMFRYERPMAGRYRQLHQFGIEAIGSADPSMDAEVIAMGYLFYKELGLRDIKIEINSVGNPESRRIYKEKLQQFFAPVKDKLSKDSQARFDRNPMRILDSKEDQAYCVGAPSILDYLDEAGKDHFQKVQQYLTDMGIAFIINSNMVRGLDYYTQTAFEYKAAGIGAIDTISGGGRYNGLVAELGGQDQPGVGFGIGLERALIILESQQVELPKAKPLDVYFISMGEAAESAVTTLLFQLRTQGLSAEKDYLNRKTKAQFKAADRYQASYVAILGDDELAKGEISLKRMETGEQETLLLSEWIGIIKDRLQLT